MSVDEQGLAALVNASKSARNKTTLTTASLRAAGTKVIVGWNLITPSILQTAITTVQGKMIPLDAAYVTKVTDAATLLAWKNFKAEWDTFYAEHNAPGLFSTDTMHLGALYDKTEVFRKQVLDWIAKLESLGVPSPVAPPVPPVAPPGYVSQADADAKSGGFPWAWALLGMGIAALALYAYTMVTVNKRVTQPLVRRVRKAATTRYLNA